MKIKEGFVLREVGETFVVIPAFETNEKFLIDLNEYAAYLWKTFAKGCDVEKAFYEYMNYFKLDANTARKDLDDFVDCCIQNGWGE